MKKELKTELTRERIISAALQEFGLHGYEAASLNTVCEQHHLSKGLIYHNFHSKDEIYLICVERVFDQLIAYIKDNAGDTGTDSRTLLKAYWSARTQFFRDNPLLLKIFCEALLFPPVHLKGNIEEIKTGFDNINAEIIRELAAHPEQPLEIAEPENLFSTLDILLYGF